jgi:hypothetical protein
MHSGGLNAARDIIAAFPATRVVMVTVSEDACRPPTGQRVAAWSGRGLRHTGGMTHREPTPAA